MASTLSELQFDRVLPQDSAPYGMICGDERIVLIKQGLGGEFGGYEQRYLKMACHLHQEYGCSVLVASNPNDGQDHVLRDQAALAQLLADARIDRPRLYLFGHSNGCIKGLALTDAGVTFERAVLVNMPLMINFHKTKRCLSAMPHAKIMAVYGEHDPSFPYLPFLEGKAQDLHVIRVAGADHNFAGLTEQYITLSDLLIQ